jgi:RNA polymerase sigma factor (sigma-70 family)
MPFNQQNTGVPFPGDYPGRSEHQRWEELEARVQRDVIDLARRRYEPAVRHEMLRLLSQRRQPGRPADDVTQFDVLPKRVGFDTLLKRGELLITGQSYDGRRADDGARGGGIQGHDVSAGEREWRRSGVERAGAPLLAAGRQHHPELQAGGCGCSGCQPDSLATAGRAPGQPAPAGSPAGWLATTTKRECGRYMRQARKVVPVDPQSDGIMQDGTSMDPDADILRAELRQALRSGLDELPARDQQLLRLRTADPPKSYDEISRLLKMPIGSIGPTLRRSLDRLRQTHAMRAYLAAVPAAGREQGGGQRELAQVD